MRSRIASSCSCSVIVRVPVMPGLSPALHEVLQERDQRLDAGPGMAL